MAFEHESDATFFFFLSCKVYSILLLVYRHCFDVLQTTAVLFELNTDHHDSFIKLTIVREQT